ncbi:1-deoxy-D-xylulose-5-phosphate reductoisomerase [bacterium]|nr:1-deoxy-D-xylulose-5-phosphate reductoisomerase [bacterium]
MKKITILGSTGSIGTQALEVIEKLENEFEVIALSCGKNIELIKEQIKKFNPKKVCTQNSADAQTLKNLFPKVEFVFGTDGLIEIAKNKENNILLVAVSGKIGLKPTIEAIKNNIDIALANKETLVMAGDYVMNLAKEHNVKILPVDSEHSAIFQCIQGQAPIYKLIITASGGPFRTKSLDDIKNATVKETLNHPNWNMGRKITVDSATLMNKGLEVIEAHHLFNVSFDDIKVVVHPESIIHSAVEFEDGSVLSQMGLPSMHIPIQYAITYPNRPQGIKTNSFDFVKTQSLTFEAPNFDKFPCLKLAFDAGKKGGTYPVCLNAANEEAVMAFLDNKIKLFDIYKIVDYQLKNYKNIENPTIDDILNEDEKIRCEVRKMIEEKIKWE